MFEKCMGLWSEAPFEVKMVKARHSLLGALLEVEMLKKYTALAQSTFPSQNVQNNAGPDHFWKFVMYKKCTPLWREAHVEVKL